MQTMELDNDMRGWIMCVVSGLACVLGASIICVDIPLRYFPSKRDFRIQDSSVFLACSLSLSFGVMLFSALYSMLPSAKTYLEMAGYEDRTAALISTACFTAGFLGIQFVSRLLHQFMPSHVVDCDHSHDEQALLESQGQSCSHGSRHHSRSRSSLRRRDSRRAQSEARSPNDIGSFQPYEQTPLLGRPETGYGSVNGLGHEQHMNRHANGLGAAATASDTALVDADHRGGGGGSHEFKPVRAISSIDTRVPSSRALSQTAAVTSASSTMPLPLSLPPPSTDPRRPSMLRVQRRVLSFVKDTKPNCDELGPCYGYSDPCGQECFKHLVVRWPVLPARASSIGLLRTTTGPFYSAPEGRETRRRGEGGGDRGEEEVGEHGEVVEEEDEDEEEEEEEGSGHDVSGPRFRTSRAQSRDMVTRSRHDVSCSSASEEAEGSHSHADSTHTHFQAHNYAHSRGHSHSHSHPPPSHPRSSIPTSPLTPAPVSSFPDPHHHHVPTNAFMSLGLQTSLAIALHKFPEGFITYATNHANPTLGFAVFMALFVHNISEGFAMALPLYMALGSRLRAMAWSALLGGLSQPLGAALAVGWFRLAGGGDDGGSGDAGRGRHGHGDSGYLAPNEVVYACLFAGTAGIMVSVALQLFVESMSLNHNRNLCIFFGFLGMVLLGLTGALVSGH